MGRWDGKKQIVKVVIGANYGDEGKGLMTDYFSGEAKKGGRSCLVVCTNGGAQRGHTVVTPEGIRHIFRHFGSGTLTGADTWMSDAFIVNPVIFREEREQLQALCRLPKVFADPSCRMTTPYDMMANQMLEEFRGKARHGSCGLGIWETVLRCRKGFGGEPLFSQNEEEIHRFLSFLREEYFPERLREEGFEQMPEDWRALFYSPGIEENFMEDLRYFQRTVRPAGCKVIDGYDETIFENGQGLLLDMGIQEHLQHTTPSRTGLYEADRILGSCPGRMDIEVCYVTRTYLTRHGAGPMENECKKEQINPDMQDLTNVPNPFQGTLRYGILDADKLKERIAADFHTAAADQPGKTWTTSIALTHVNETPGDGPDRSEGLKAALLDRKERTYLSDGMTRESVYYRCE